jgi:hypothetical protein
LWQVLVEKMGLPGGYTPSLDSSDLLSMYSFLPCKMFSVHIVKGSVIITIHLFIFYKGAVNGGTMLLRE